MKLLNLGVSLLIVVFAFNNRSDQAVHHQLSVFEDDGSLLNDNPVAEVSHRRRRRDLLSQNDEQGKLRIKENLKKLKSLRTQKLLKLLLGVVDTVPEAKLLTDVRMMVKAFLTFTKDYNKTYSNSAEKKQRYQLFKNSVGFLVDHNRKNSSFKLGITEFADFTFQEMLQKRTGLFGNEAFDKDEQEEFEIDQDEINKWVKETEEYESTLPTVSLLSKNGTATEKLIKKKPVSKTVSSLGTTLDKALRRRKRATIKATIKPEKPRDVKQPKSWDWREFNILTPIRNQGTCGSCWSFASAASLEAYNMKRLLASNKFMKNNQIFVSEQNLIDCSAKFGTLGCKGGMPQQGWKYVITNKGIAKYDQYPYAGKKDECKFRNELRERRVIIVGAKKLPKKNEQYLEQAIFNYGPIAVAIQITKKLMYFKSGIFEDPLCTDKVNHAVVAVGYGEENGQKYWIIRNSWSEKWGESGYYRLSRRNPNHCGVLMQQFWPIVPGAKDTVEMLDVLGRANPKAVAASGLQVQGQGIQRAGQRRRPRRRRLNKNLRNDYYDYDGNGAEPPPEPGTEPGGADQKLPDDNGQVNNGQVNNEPSRQVINQNNGGQINNGPDAVNNNQEPVRRVPEPPPPDPVPEQSQRPVSVPDLGPDGGQSDQEPGQVNDDYNSQPRDDIDDSRYGGI